MTSSGGVWGRKELQEGAKEDTKEDKKTDQGRLWFGIFFIIENFYELLYSFNILCMCIINYISFHISTYQKAQNLV